MLTLRENPYGDFQCPCCDAWIEDVNDVSHNHPPEDMQCPACGRLLHIMVRKVYTVTPMNQEENNG